MKLKYGLVLLCSICFLSACSSFKKQDETPEPIEEELGQKWSVEGRSPEWGARVNGRRFEASLPGAYENKMVRWKVEETENTTLLKSPDETLTLRLTKGACTVAGNSKYTHAAALTIDNKTFNGCATAP